MDELKNHGQHHWTALTTGDFLYRIAADFTRQLEAAMEAAGVSRQELARRLNISKGRVSQVLNNPGNMTLRNIVEYPLALGQKVAIVTYNDGDSANEYGPINAEVFSTCWQLVGKPHDAFDLTARPQQSQVMWFRLEPESPNAATVGFHHPEQHHLSYGPPQMVAATTTEMMVRVPATKH